MQKFELVIKNEKIKQYKTIAILVIFINLVFFATLAINNSDYKTRSLFTIAIIIAGFFIQHFTKKRKQGYAGTGAAVLFILLFYIQTGYWLPAIAIILLSVLYVISIRPLIVSVNSNHIIYPSFPKKTIRWDELNNIMLKDGLLTIDFKNNKLAQVEVINNETGHAVDEKEFNDFCKMQLDAGTVVA